MVVVVADQISISNLSRLLIEIWSASPKMNLAPLQIEHNKLMKVLFHYDFLTPTYKIYRETKIIDINLANLNIQHLHFDSKAQPILSNCGFFDFFSKMCRLIEYRYK